MAKVTRPLYSISATGRFGANLRYQRGKRGMRAVRNRTNGAVQGIGQRRQASLISEAGRLWTSRNGRGPEKSYRAYIAAVSRENWYYMTGAVLLEWDENTLMPAN